MSLQRPSPASVYPSLSPLLPHFLPAPAPLPLISAFPVPASPARFAWLLLLTIVPPPFSFPLIPSRFESSFGARFPQILALEE
ncbi:hypothetical protein G6F42_018738 [Rhizopus arrhizus]|nr:hypothetical protein G6F42_018738 [Rhizopus arrhizus]